MKRFLTAFLTLFLLLFPMVYSVFAQTCETSIDGHQVCDFAITDHYGLLSAPSVSPTGTGRMYFDLGEGKFKCSEDGASYVDCIGGISAGGSGNAFTEFTFDAGGSVLADGSADTFTMTSSDGSILIEGTSALDLANFRIATTITGRTFDADANTFSNFGVEEFDSSSLSGTSSVLMTGTAGSVNEIATFGADSDIVGSTVFIGTMTNGGRCGYAGNLWSCDYPTPSASGDITSVGDCTTDDCFSVGGTGTDLFSTTGNFTIGSVGGSNNESLEFDFESTTNGVTISSTTGVGLVSFDTTVRANTISLYDGGSNYTTISSPTLSADVALTTPNFSGRILVTNQSEITADPSPALCGTTYYSDTSGGGFTITLPDTSSANDGCTIKIVVIDATNSLTVTTTSGTDLIGDTTTQAISNVETGFTIQSDFNNTTWHIIQDSRPKTPQSQISAYGLTESGAVGGYNRLALSSSDSDYSSSQTDQALSAITGSDILLGGWVADAGAIVGLLEDVNVQLFFSVKKDSGSGNAYFYVLIYHRNSGGTETLIGTSGISQTITSASYDEHDIAAPLTSQQFTATDYFVIKLYGTKVGGGSDPVYSVALEGFTQPARAVIPVASSLVNINNLGGILVHEKGGLEVDVSSYSGIVGVNSGATSEVDTFSELDTLITDKSLVNLEDNQSYSGGITFAGTMATQGAVTFESNVNGFNGVWDLGGVSSFELPNGSGPTVDTTGEIAVDTTEDQLAVMFSTTMAITPWERPCAIIENLAAADDDMMLGTADVPVVVTKIGCRCRGTCTTVAGITLQDDDGNSMTHGAPTCASNGADITFQSVTAGNFLTAGEGLMFDTTNTPSPETDTYEICPKGYYVKQ